MPASHRLAAKKRVKTTDLEDEKLLLLEEGHCLRDQALEVCDASAPRSRTSARPASRRCGRWSRRASGSRCCRGLPPWAPSHRPAGLTVRPFAPPAPNRMVGAAWRRSSSRGEAIRAVCDIIARAG